MNEDMFRIYTIVHDVLMKSRVFQYRMPNYVDLLEVVWYPTIAVTSQSEPLILSVQALKKKCSKLDKHILAIKCNEMDLS